MDRREGHFLNPNLGHLSSTRSFWDGEKGSLTRARRRGIAGLGEELVHFGVRITTGIGEHDLLDVA